MNITIIGTGNMGSTLAKYFAEAGHSVSLGSREAQKGAQIAAEIGHGVKGGTITDALLQGDIVFLAVPHVAMAETLKATGPLADKVVVDMSNPFEPPNFDLSIGHTTSAAEEIAKQIPKAKVVKAFSNVFATVLKKGSAFDAECVQIFYAGDDEEATRRVAEIIRSAGFKAINAGGLKSARYIEPVAALTIQVDKHLDHDVQIAAAMLERAQ